MPLRSTSPRIHVALESSGCCTLLLVWVLGSIEIAKRTDEKFMQGFTGTPAAAGESENKQQMLLDLRGELVPERSEGRRDRWVGQEVGWA